MSDKIKLTLQESNLIFSELLVAQNQLKNIMNEFSKKSEINLEDREKIDVACECIKNVFDSFSTDENLKLNENVKHKLLNSAKNCIEESLMLNNGNYITISPEIATKICNVYDQLTFSNQEKLINMLCENERSFLKTVDFCEKYF